MPEERSPLDRPFMTERMLRQARRDRAAPDVDSDEAFRERLPDLLAEGLDERRQAVLDVSPAEMA